MKKILSVVLASIVMQFEFSTLADTWTDPDTGIAWTYATFDGQAAPNGWGNEVYLGPKSAIPTNTVGDVVVPSKLGGFPVTGIASAAFYDCGLLEAVVIQEGVTFISDYVFYGCSNLTSVSLPSTVTKIGSYSFRFCERLKRLDLPYGLEQLGAYVFSESGIKELRFHGTPPKGIAKASIPVNTTIYYPLSYESEWNTVIADCGFENCQPLTWEVTLDAYPLLEPTNITVKAGDRYEDIPPLDF